MLIDAPFSHREAHRLPYASGRQKLLPTDGWTLVLGVSGSLGGQAFDRIIEIFGANAVVAEFHCDDARIKEKHRLGAIRRAELSSGQSIA